MPDGHFGSFGGVAPVLPGRDEEIMSFCAAIMRLHQVSGEFFHNPACGSPAEQALTRIDLQPYEQEARMVRHMCKLRAHSMEAHRMRALLLGAWFPADVQMTWADCENATAIVNATIRDLISSAFD